MSVLVTGVPTRKRAKRKLKTREVEPRGATYSVLIEETLKIRVRNDANAPARRYSRARVLPRTWDRLERQG